MQIVSQSHELENENIPTIKASKRQSNHVQLIIEPSTHQRLSIIVSKLIFVWIPLVITYATFRIDTHKRKSEGIIYTYIYNKFGCYLHSQKSKSLNICLQSTNSISPTDCLVSTPPSLFTHVHK